MDFLRHPKNKNDGYFDHRQNEQNANFLQNDNSWYVFMLSYAL